jgi:transcriptional regulator with XRE-family HTH domain
VRQEDHQTDIKKRFGLAIKQRRHELGISQEELSFRAKLHRTYISDIERGSRNPSLENIEKLAKALDISVSALFAKYGIEGQSNG